MDVYVITKQKIVIAVYGTYEDAIRFLIDQGEVQGFVVTRKTVL